MARIPEINYNDPGNPQHSSPVDIDLPSAPQPAATTTSWPSLATDQQIPEYSHHPFLTPGYNSHYETGPGPAPDIRTRTGTGTGTSPTQDLTGIPPPPPLAPAPPGQPAPPETHPIHAIHPHALPGPAPKVPIPRVSAAAGSSDIPSRRRRSPRACEPCRQRKIKCEGTRPACRQCVESHITCQYQDVKRVREQKQLGMLGRKVDRYEGLLRELEPEVETGLARKIRRVLKEPEDIENSEEENSSVGSLDAIDLVEEDLNRNEQTRAVGFFGKNSEVAWMQKLEAEAQHRAQRTLEDIEETQAAQFFGSGSGSGKPQRPIPITMVSYYLDDLEIPQMEDVDQALVPPRELADRFFSAYMETFHPSYNAVRCKTFTMQYRRFIRGPGIVRPPKKWLAILNMVFAVGCHYCRLTGEDTGEEDGLVFMTRARKLSLTGDVLFEHSDLQQVQVEFLFAFYLLARGQVNRASKFSNMAFRSALSLGINLRFVDDRTDDAAKEARSRLWWSIYILEHSIASITGRVSCTSESLSSVPLPIPFDEVAFDNPHVKRLFHDKSLRQRFLKPTLFQTDEESRMHAEWLNGCEPCPSLFFFCVVDLIFIAQAVINKVYSIEGIRERSSRIEKRIRKYAIKMDNWLAKVPGPYRFTRTTGKEATNGDLLASENPGADSIDCARKLKLAMHFYSSKITLCRPCLTHSDARSNSPFLNISSNTSTSTGPGNTTTNPDPTTRSESNPSNPSESTSRSTSTGTNGPAKEHRTRFRTEISLSCLRASCALISLLPDEPDIIRLNRLSPWWEHLHYLMQATTALLLGLARWPTSPPAEEKYASSATASTPGMPVSATSSTSPASALASVPPSAPATLEVPTVVVAAKKALRWLFHMAAADGGGGGGGDSAARRAFVLCDGFMRRIAPSVGVDVGDLPEVGALSAHAHAQAGLGLGKSYSGSMGADLGDDVLAGTGAGVGAAAPGTGPGEGGVGGMEGANESEAEMERNEVRFEREMDLEMGLEVGGYGEEGDSSSESDREEVRMGEG